MTTDARTASASVGPSLATQLTWWILVLPVTQLVALATRNFYLLDYTHQHQPGPSVGLCRPRDHRGPDRPGIGHPPAEKMDALETHSSRQSGHSSKCCCTSGINLAASLP